MKPTLANFHQKRFDWALNAKKEFINRFVRLEVEEVEAPNHKELTISVYGPTQVGKTTVILTLLGIKEEKIGQISKWLRGKRNLGESSTVTVMRYQRSDDHFFHILLPNKKTKPNLTGEQMEKELQALRSSVETQHSYSVEPVVVEIPVDYFVESNVKMNIVDLPGVESAELKEVEHVNQCIKHWLPLSEVCLLVDDATSLTAFSQYTLRDIKNWYDTPENFRVIPTHALSLDNIRKKIEKDQILSAEDLIRDYAFTLNRMLKTDVDLTKTIYPIDVGQSWETFREKEPHLFEKMENIMREILQTLRKDLESIEISDVSFSRLTKLYRETEEASKHELKVIVKKIDQLKNFVSNQEFLKEQEVKILSKKTKHLTKDLEEYTDFSNELKSILKHYNKSTIDEHVKMFEFNTSNRKASELNRDALTLQLNLEDQLEQDILQIKSTAQLLKRSEWFNLQPPTLDTVPMIYKNFDKYLLKGNYIKDYFYIKERAKDWLEESYDIIIHFLTPIFEYVKTKVCKLAEKEKAEKLLNKTRNDTLQKEIDAKNTLLNELIDYQKTVKELWQQDVKHATQLQSYFIKHWLIYKEELEQRVLYGTTEERWLATQYLNLLVQDGDTIINSLNLKGEKTDDENRITDPIGL